MVQSRPKSDGSTKLSAVQLPADDTPSLEFVIQLQQSMLNVSSHCKGAAALRQVLPPTLLTKLVQEVTTILESEPTLTEVQLSASQQKVTVVGDTHGQLHDVCRMFEMFGQPSSDRVYIINGDYVDRGAWGVETLTLMLAWKWLLPKNVYLIRGNHETSYCTKVYGFGGELKAKYGKATTQLYNDILKLFQALPLAVLVNSNTLILHGGLFREPVALKTGTLDDLRAAGKGGKNPDPDTSEQLVASDILWSDPSPNLGQRDNEVRGIGTIFGPDVTEAFLAHNKLKLIIRSHEGPDGRHKRASNEKMGSINDGYSVDHVCSSGRLVTVFSAPDYPQFMAEGQRRYNNRAAVVHLTAPDYATPQVESFEAYLPRPQAQPYYKVDAAADTDHEAPSSASADEQDSMQDDEQHVVEQQQHVVPAAVEIVEQHTSGSNRRSSRSSKAVQQQVGPVAAPSTGRSTRSSSKR